MADFAWRALATLATALFATTCALAFLRVADREDDPDEEGGGS